ncbi:MAG: ATP-binding protein [Kiritimatiellae bacterium]|nr:ATP-binding protein [Kiritimatiellia bacterium]
MKFYDREKEIAELRAIRERSRKSAQWTVVMGRRRIGKTSLVQMALGDEPYLYFFVARKAEADLCETFAAEVEEKLSLPIGAGGNLRFAQIFETVLKFSQTRHVTLFIDEFQDFVRVNQAVFSEMQDLWGRYERTAKINLVVCGSVNTLLNRIFRDRKEPLYGRQTGMMTVLPFRTDVLRAILAEHNPRFTNDDLLALWTYTGGVAKYVALLMDAGATDKASMLQYIVREDSFFIDEGRAVLVDEFGKGYGTYFSILSGIARGRTTRNELEQFIGAKIGGHLTRLEDDYGVIGRRQPLLSKPSAKNLHYAISDGFFLFWFRFVERYGHLVEMRMFDELRRMVERDYETFSGFALERWFRERLLEKGGLTRLGTWWDRKGENEIDIIAANEAGEWVDFYEVKRDASRFSADVLREKAGRFLDVNPEWKGYTARYLPLCLKDMWE